MKLLRVESQALIAQVAGWLADPANYQWLDFGGGIQVVTPALLNVMRQRQTHFLRAYTNEVGEPIGIVALNDVSRRLGTATLWGVTGEKSFSSRGYATLAASRFLTLAFAELGLSAVSTWLVDCNPSRRVIERLNFRYVGRMRQCHRLGDEIHDRLYYDLLADEHRELRYEDLQGILDRRARSRDRPESQLPDPRRAV